MDRRDRGRIGFTLVRDTTPDHDFFYELIFFTGTRKNAQTDSKVSCILTGDMSETGVKLLIDNGQKIFRRGGVNSFLISSAE
jgi:hypothetical protein